MGNHWQANGREKDPTSAWDMLSLEGCVRQPGGGVQPALDMNPQGLRLGCICENDHHIDGSGDHGCGWVCPGRLQSVMRRGGT